ncbi:flagellar basal body P-ring formation chaperone FlgA [Ancylobacter sp. IITR112]|uniref:flagellar basal body P-ring formation chaperone FlgA n=1 Tax=Ancylobacter sp. IITR112 TaxID=3138073 RepID=UPI003529EB50
MTRLLPGGLLALALSCALMPAVAPALAQSAAARQRPIADTVSGMDMPPAPAPAPVPAAPAAPVASQISLPVAATNIAPGETITAAMLAEKAFPASMANQYPLAVNHGQLVGKVARRPLAAGNAIPVAAVAEAQLVTRGVATELRFEQDGLSIRALGVPLESGSLGAMVKLKNADSGKVVAGIVQADGSVKVSAP